jgi:2',3'-cyclic-nucleotide 2'-phosphodiesterase/3'-nucleotidase
LLRWLGILLCALALNAQEVRLRVLASTDLRGRILAQDSFTLQPTAQGWVRLAPLIRSLRAADPATLLVDCGDATQGEPTGYVWSRIKPNLPEPSTAIMNALGYNAMVVGPHDLLHGMARLRAAEALAQFPWLAANVTFAADGGRPFTPYLVLDQGGVRVAILGLTAPPPFLPAATDPAAQLIFQDPVNTAAAFVPLLRGKERADLVIVVLHGGNGSDSCTVDEESEVRCLAAQVPGIDLIVASHARQQLAPEVNGVAVLQGGSGGSALGVCELVLRKGPKSGWEVESRSVRVLQPGPDAAADPEVLDLTAPIRSAAETYLDTFATSLGTDLDGRWTRMEDTPVMHLMHAVAQKASGAQITALPTPGTHLFIPKGPTSVRQFYALVPGEDRICRIRVTGRQLRAYLEQAARFFNYSHDPELFNKAFDPRDYDTLSGCEYALDISRPPGQRVVSLTVQNEPVTDTQAFTLGLISSRLGGAGGYLAAMGWTGKPETESAEPFRNLLLDYVLSRPSLTLAADDHWRLIPSLDRERVLAQQP